MVSLLLFFPSLLILSEFCLPLSLSPVWEYSYRFVSFVHLFKEPVLNFIDFLLSLFHLFPLWSLLFPSFYYFWVSFVLLSLIAGGVKLGCLFEVFLGFWYRYLLLWIFPLEQLSLYPLSFGMLYFHFDLSQGIFLLSFISSLTH